tara:strand:- start:188 stop:499 length:312 start_codon:yes stop_codon:yes gene_type:complete
MGNIYLVNMIDTDLYKIGYTKRDIDKRVDELQTGNPNKIEPVRLFETKHYVTLETYMHNRHASKRREGEWFALTDDDVVNFINDCQRGHDTIQMLVESGNPFI